MKTDRYRDMCRQRPEPATATIASEVIIKPAIETAFCSADPLDARLDGVGSASAIATVATLAAQPELSLLRSTRAWGRQPQLVRQLGETRVPGIAQDEDVAE